MSCFLVFSHDPTGFVVKSAQVGVWRSRTSARYRLSLCKQLTSALADRFLARYKAGCGTGYGSRKNVGNRIGGSDAAERTMCFGWMEKSTATQIGCEAEKT